ncbi:MAG TPA: NAD(P)/FAD-dependent oxidoreductase [Gammaproteobacteria bacterium]|nr:NAD(P)/FAD-dependent oxidoreductase [Gammaproteobacteria bacterium]
MKTDIVIIGGGPGGSTAATFLARKGWRVVMLEKDCHPRFHIGESMLPKSLPIFRELGVMEEVERIGVPKYAADFANYDDEWGKFTTYYFRNALSPQDPNAFEVKRSELDELLFENARANGVDARQQVTVLDVEHADDGSAVVQAETSTGEALRFETRYVIDASGRGTFYARKLKLKQNDPRHRSAAIFAHYRGVKRREGEHEGNIGIYWIKPGWAWVIPLSNGVTSVGCVCWPWYLKKRGKTSTDEFLQNTLREAPAIWSRMADAEMASEARVEGNYSYYSTRIGGKGWVMVGDAYRFIDAVFSSGVYLALSSARRVADMVDISLREPSREAALQDAYKREVDRGLRNFSWFIYRFTSPKMQQLFGQPRNFWGVQQAVTSMLSGDVYDNRSVIVRLWLFKLIYRFMGSPKPYLEPDRVAD